MAVHKLDELIDQQVRRWQAARAEAGGGAKGTSVAVSRLPFSGAGEIAHLLGARLGYGVFGREIVDQIAEEEGISKTLVAGLDEHVESAIERHVVDGFSRRKFTESDYLRDAVRIVSTLGMRGHTVVVGRGAASVLPVADTLRVLIVAPKEARQKRLAESDGLSLDAAGERMSIFSTVFSSSNSHKLLNSKRIAFTHT